MWTLLLALPVFGADVTVPGDAPDLASALLMVGSGDRILLAAGTHPTAFTVSTDLTIEGAGMGATRRAVGAAVVRSACSGSVRP